MVNFDEILGVGSLWAFTETKVRYVRAFEPVSMLRRVSYRRYDYDYITSTLETDGIIRVVVGLNLEYKTRKVTVFIWQPQYVTIKRRGGGIGGGSDRASSKHII